MKKIIIPIVVLLSIALSFVTCKKTPCGIRTETINVLGGDKAVVPYTDSTKITFVRTSTGDTHTFVGQKHKYDYLTVIPHPDDGCPMTYNLQRQYQIFISPTFASSITVSLPSYYLYGDYLQIDFQNISYITDPAGIRSPYEFDSLIIQNKFYHKIRYFKNNYHPEHNDKYGCFYNIDQGILKMETEDGDKWELLKIE